MRLFGKMFLPVGVTLASLCFLSVTTVFTMRSVNEEVTKTSATRQAAQLAAQDARAGLLTVHSGAYRVLTWAGSDDAKKVEAKTKDLLAEAAKVEDRFKAWSSGGLAQDEGALAKASSDLMAKYRKSVFQALDMATSDMTMGMSGMQTADKDFKDLDDKLAALVELEKRLTADAADAVSKRMGAAVLSTGVTALLSTVVALAIAFYLAGGVSRRLGETASSMRKMADGNLGVRLPDSSENDEVSDTIRAIETFKQAVARTVADMNEASGRVLSSADKSKREAVGLSSSASGQMSAVDRVVGSVERMGRDADGSLEMVEAAKDAAKRTSELARDGLSAVDVAVSGVSGISDAVRETSSTMAALADSSKRIRGMAESIRDIANQTNLLALNAAIEAARAGEQGRGFAVVADEVRKLAERTAEATGEITGTLDSIVEQTEKASSLMAGAETKTVEGVAAMDGIRAPMDGLVTASDESFADLAKLASTIGGQKATADGIVNEMRSLSTAARATGAAASSGLSVAEEIGKEADRLRQAASRFHE